jgi:hypothetical protein
MCSAVAVTLEPDSFDHQDDEEAASMGANMEFDRFK